MPGTTFTVFNLNQTPNLETMIIATPWRFLLRIGVLRSSPEFVNALAELVDDLCITPGTSVWESAENVWKRVIELEIGFWPEDGEELSMRINL